MSDRSQILKDIKGNIRMKSHTNVNNVEKHLLQVKIISNIMLNIKRRENYINVKVDVGKRTFINVV